MIRDIENVKAETKARGKEVCRSWNAEKSEFRENEMNNAAFLKRIWETTIDFGVEWSMSRENWRKSTLRKGFLTLKTMMSDNVPVFPILQI